MVTILLRLIIAGVIFIQANFALDLESLHYADYEVMKLTSTFRVEVSSDATHIEIKDSILDDLKMRNAPGSLTFRSDLLSKRITDLHALSELENAARELWSGEGRLFKVTQTKASSISLKPTLPIIYVYKDDGVSEFSANVCVDAFSAQSDGAYHIELIDSAGVINGNLTNAAAFIIPGGADLKYCAKLNGIGNAQIRRFVENGGTYIGFCAGAYYACKKCVFINSGGNVVEPRELGFYKGDAIGPILAEYDPTSRSGVRIAEIKLDGDARADEKVCNIYYNGGCCFEGYTGEDVKIIGTYANEGNAKGRPAIIECKVGKGLAILSGMHPECSATNMQQIKDTVTSEIFSKLEDQSHMAVMRMIMEKIRDQYALRAHH